MVSSATKADRARNAQDTTHRTANGRRHVLLLTGPPGIGKTTLLRRVAAALGDRRLAGFTTEEVRERGQRVGFRIAPHGGKARIMAHVDFDGPPRVGRYGVDVAAVGAVAEETLALDPTVSLYLVDEIGRMECLSPRFVARMRALLDSMHIVIASVALRGDGFIAEAKARPDVALWKISLRNRDELVQRILTWLEPDRRDPRQSPAPRSSGRRRGSASRNSRRGSRPPATSG